MPGFKAALAAAAMANRLKSDAHETKETQKEDKAKELEQRAREAGNAGPLFSGTGTEALTLQLRQLGEREGITAIVEAMNAEPKQIGVQIAGCTAFAMQTWGSRLASAAILRADGGQAIVRAMNAHTDQCAVAEMGLVALANLACGDAAYSELMAGEGVADAVCAAMRAFGPQQSATIHGLRILSGIATHGSADAVQALLTAKGDQSILQAMRAHPTQLAVQEAGVVAVGALARSCSAAKS